MQRYEKDWKRIDRSKNQFCIEANRNRIEGKATFVFDKKLNAIMYDR